MTKWRPALLLTGSVVAAALLFAACSSAPSRSGNGATTSPGSAASSGGGQQAASGAIVSPAQARAVVAPTMATNNEANAKLDTSLLASYESGSAFMLDNATYEADRAARFLPPASPFTVDLSEIGLVHRTAWPASFLAVGTQRDLAKGAPKGPVCGTVLDFERTSPRARWRIALEPSVNGSSLPRLARAAGGFEPAVPAARGREVGRVPGEVRAAFLAEETSGQLGPFTKSDFNGSCWQLPNPRLDLVQAETSGFGQRDLFATAPRPDTAAFELAGGSTLVIFTLETEDQLVQTASANPIVWTHPSLSKQPGAAWTYFLPAGSYSQVTERGAIEIAVVLSPSGKRWSVVGAYSGVTQVSGHRTKSAGSTPGTTLTAFRI